MGDFETEFNTLYQKTMAFYENAMNGDKTHPFVLFKIKQLKLKKNNFKKIKEAIGELDQEILRSILLLDLQAFVQDIKDYELKMKEIKESKKARKPQRPQQNRKFDNSKSPKSNNFQKGNFKRTEKR